MIQSCGINLAQLYNRVGDDRPRTAGEAHGVGMTLLREPKAPVRKRAGVRPDMDAILHEPTEENLLILCRMLLGSQEMERNGGWWRTVARARPKRMHEALLDLRMLKPEGRGPDNPAAWLSTVVSSWPPTKSKTEA